MSLFSGKPLGLSFSRTIKPRDESGTLKVRVAVNLTGSSVCQEPGTTSAAAVAIMPGIAVPLG